MNKRRLAGWKRWALGFAACGLLLAAGTVLAQNADYERGRAALDNRNWKEAVRAFAEASRDGREDADAALYWEAYALNKLDQTARALTVIDKLQRRYPDSRWFDDAEVLHRELSGESADTLAKEEVKLVALMSLVQSNSDQALPYLKKFLNGPHSIDGKEQALFLLMQTGSGEAMEIVADMVRNGDNPELRVSAIHSLGMVGDPAAHKLLGEVYDETGNREVKEAILEAFMMSGSQAALLSVARSETDEELRADAISLLGSMGAVEELGELYELYEREASREAREALLEAFMIAGDKERVLAAARNESDPELRAEAVEFLGMMGAMEELWEMYGRESNLEVKEAILEGLAISGGGGRYLKAVATGNDPVELRAAAIEGLDMTGETPPDYLIEIYTSSDEEEIAEAALQALMMGGHVQAMISIAKQEQDPERKREIIEYLAMTGSEEATEYMLELLDE